MAEFYPTSESTFGEVLVEALKHYRLVEDFVNDAFRFQ